MAAAMKALQLRQYMDMFLSKETRADGRTFTQGRKVSVSTGTIDTADGSSSVKIGNSSCLTGLKAIVVKSSPDQSKELVSIVVRMPHNWDQIRHNHPYLGDSETVSTSLGNKLTASLLTCLDLKSLVIVPDKYVWSLEIELIYLDYDGNYEDLAFLSLITCLRNTSLPKVTVNTSSGEAMSNILNLQDQLVYSDKKITKLVLSEVPLNCSFVQLKDNFLLDATLDEESLASGCISITSTYPSGTITSLAKLGGSPIDFDAVLPHLIQVARERCNYLHSQH